jgi:metal-responsive CopG/Arc/MetJ family transcriptional regulator
MKTARQKANVKRAQGRPKVDDPKVSTTLRFDPELIAALDAWAKENGGMGRSAAIRYAVSNLVRGRDAEKNA